MTFLMLMLLGQVDGGLSPPPPPPANLVPEGATFPRVIRTPGKVCVESLDEFGAVQTDCRRDDEVAAIKPAPLKGPASRVVADLGVLGGGLLGASATLVPEFAFSADVGVRFRNGVGVVGLLHGNLTAPIGRYGVGAGLRLGDRSHVTLAASMGPIIFSGASPLSSPRVLFSATVLAQLALVFANHFGLLLMPSLTVTEGGAIGSVTAGLGLTF